MNARTGLLLSSGLYLLSAGIGSVVAIRQRLPANWAGIVTGHDVANDFVSWKGTALSPPVGLMLAQVGLTLAALRGDQTSQTAVKGLVALGIMYTIGMLGERIVLRVFKPQTFDPVQATIVVANVVLPLSMTAFGIAELRRVSTAVDVKRET